MSGDRSRLKGKVNKEAGEVSEGIQRRLYLYFSPLVALAALFVKIPLGELLLGKWAKLPSRFPRAPTQTTVP